MSTDPSKRTQCDAIFEALQRGETLTPYEALRRFGCMRLAARINDLRKQGLSIKTVVMRYKSKRYAGYALEA